MTGHEAEAALNRIEAALHEIDRGRLEEEYREARGGEKTDADRWAAAERALLEDPEYRSALLATGIHGAARSSDLARRMELHKHRADAARVRLDPEIRDVLRSLADASAAFDRSDGTEAGAGRTGAGSSTVDATPPGLLHPDRGVREEAWFRLAPLAEAIEPEVVRLLALRNETARRTGFATFAELAFATAELERFELMGLCDELEQLTRGPYEAFLARARDSLGVEALEPWDLELALSMPHVEAEPEPPSIDQLRRAALALGFDPARLPQLEALAVPGRESCCFPVDIPADVRVILGSSGNRQLVESSWRESGRGLYKKHLPAEVAYQWEAPSFDQAMGDVFQRLARSLDPAGPTEPDPPRTWRDILDLRRALAASLFEILVYERPEGDLHSLFSELEEHYLGFPRHPERMWAVQEFLITTPLQAPNYIMSRLIGAHIVEGLGEIGPETGRRLVEDYWKDGARIGWQEKLRLSSGKPLDPDAFRRLTGIPESA